MYIKNSLFIIYGVFLVLLSSCANPIAPQGGQPDETPPSVVVEKSTPNFKTNFQPKEIVLTFDEWVKLRDAQKQVIISPPIQGYSVRLKGKSVILDLGDKDTLRTNATYVIQFGEAVQDLTESNPAEDLRFVFSTGDYIDSLEVQGQVLDAYTNEPVESAVVMLYDNLADTVVRTERPFYFSRTNENGQFLITNVREGRFKVFALLDVDGNYRFNQAGESIGFMGAPLELKQDSVPGIAMRLFQENLPLRRLSVDTSHFGQLKLVYNQPVTNKLEISGALPPNFLQAFEKDTSWLWYQSPSSTTIYLQSDTLYADTFRLASAPSPVNGTPLDSLRVLRFGHSNKPHNPGKAFPIRFARPIHSIDTALVLLQFDSLDTPLNYQWQIDSLDARTVYFNHNWKEDSLYRWTILPDGVSDYWGQKNEESFSHRFTLTQKKKLGNFLFRFSDDKTNRAIIARLVDKDGGLIERFLIKEQQAVWQIKLVPPGEYTLELILDKNQNESWDTGSYDHQIQPEQVQIRTLETLRANWDLEVDIDLSSLFKGEF